MIKHSVILLLSFGLVTSAFAGAVTEKDLAGKKICWTSGASTTYGPGNKYSDTFGGNGTWRITPIGVEMIGSSYSFTANIQKLPDGTFTFSATIGGSKTDSTGKYCK